MSTARFCFWIFAVALISAGGYIIHPSLGLLFPGVIILIQVVIGEVYAIYRNTITVPKRK